MESYKLDYDKYSIYGVSHLYGLFCLAWVINENSLDVEDLPSKLNSFYQLLRGKADNPITKEYQTSMNAGTKSRSRRIMRINSLLEFLGQNRIQIKKTSCVSTSSNYVSPVSGTLSVLRQSFA